MQYRKNELYHMNPYHDPKDGKFTFAKGVRKIKNAANKALRWIDGQDELDAIMAKKEAVKRGEKKSSESVRPSTHEEELNDLIEMEKTEEIKKTSDLAQTDVGRSLTNEGGFTLDNSLERYPVFKKNINAEGNDKTSSKHELHIDAVSLYGVEDKNKLLSDISKIERNISKIDKSVRSQVASQVFKEKSFPIEYEKDGSGKLKQKSFEVSNEKELAERIGKRGGKSTGSLIDFLPAANGRTNNYAQIYYDDDGLWGGHLIVAEYDFDKDKVVRYSIEG